MHKCPLFYDEHILKHTKVILILFKQVTTLTKENGNKTKPRKI